MTEKSVWQIVKEAAKIIGVAKGSPHHRTGGIRMVAGPQPVNATAEMQRRSPLKDASSPRDGVRLDDFLN
jgi:hypothetical protein